MVIGCLTGNRVVLNGQYSGWRDVLSGVPQGSVLDQYSVIYINDIDDSVNCKILKFADDTKIYEAIYSEEDLCKFVPFSSDYRRSVCLCVRDRMIFCRWLKESQT